MSKQQTLRIIGITAAAFLVLVLFALIEMDYRELEDLQRRVGTIEANRK